MPSVGTIREIWRYPVKSMGGEQLDTVEVTEGGLAADRVWAVRDEDRGAIVGGRQLPALMRCRARFVEAPAIGARVAITLPDGAEVTSDDPEVHARLSAALGRTVTLCALRPASDADHYRTVKYTQAEWREHFGVAPGEPLPDFSMFPASLLAELYRFATPRGTYYDAYPVSVLTTASLATIGADVRRLRPNLLVDTGDATGLVELGWQGGTLDAGEAAIAVEVRTVRCAMTTHAQAELPADRGVLRTIVEKADRCLGVYARVARAGRVRVGDVAAVEVAAPSRLGMLAGAGVTSLKRLGLRAAAKALPED